MNAKVSLLFGCMSLVALSACTLADDKPIQKRQAQLVAPRAERPAVTATKPASNFLVIGYLEKRGQTITIRTGPKGPVYSAETTEGKTLFENPSVEQLHAQEPEIHELIRTAVASGSGQLGVVMDASVRPTR